YAKDLYQAIQGLTKSSQSALTGDSTYILPMMLTMTIAGCGIYLLRKKKERNG
ncbi:LPXTG cell wall anchor domain-containing protein, partial [Coprobacillus cateniformis]|nr:LPXTG cell wall anchor domain-containing protein [Coprobacillus cateniformis]